MESVRAQVEIQVFGESVEAIARRCSGHPALAACWSLLMARALDESLELSLAERCCGIDRSYLNRLLNQHTGRTFHQLRIELRLVEAAVLLLETEGLAIDIGFEVGFGSPRSFQRNFRRQFGMTARAYRARHAASDS